ncbi:nucleoside transporter-domain-containing protein [Chiua virens]|nr:nucleoside transporter-domain-containing protein [Chiua virens]
MPFLAELLLTYAHLSKAMINATSFFLSRLDGSSFYTTFSPSLSTVYTLTNMFSQLYCTITLKQSSPSRRIFTSIIVSTILVSSLCLSTFFRGTPSLFFSYTLLSMAIFAVVTGYLCTAVLAGAALLGQSFLQIVLSGQAAVAVAVSAVQVISAIISLWGSSPESPRSISDDQAEALAARIFFAVSTIFLVVTFTAYAWLNRQPFYQSIVGTLERHHETGHANELTGLVTGADSNSPKAAADSRVFYVLKRNLIFFFSVAYTFCVTLAVYPAVTVRVQSVDHIHPLLFTSLHFLAFNVGDLIGRWSCSFPCLVVWSGRKILVMSLLRTLFIPLILLCNFHPSSTVPLVSPLINSDIFYMIILLALGYTTGYVVSLSMLAVSSLAHNPRLEGRHEDVDVAATLGGSFMNVGLAAGALSSFIRSGYDMRLYISGKL